MAENRDVEAKMRKRNLIGYLVFALDLEQDIELSAVVLKFLKKLSIFKENKNDMVRFSLIMIP